MVCARGQAGSAVVGLALYCFLGHLHNTSSSGSAIESPCNSCSAMSFAARSASAIACARSARLIPTLIDNPDRVVPNICAGLRSTTRPLFSNAVWLCPANMSDSGLPMSTRTMIRCPLNFDGGRAALAHNVFERARGNGARLPLAVGFFYPEYVLDAVSDRQAPVGRTLRNHALRPEVHREVRPVVRARGELVLLALELPLPRFMLRHEAPERRHHQHHAIVERRIPYRSMLRSAKVRVNLDRDAAQLRVAFGHEVLVRARQLR